METQMELNPADYYRDLIVSGKMKNKSVDEYEAEFKKVNFIPVFVDSKMPYIVRHLACNWCRDNGYSFLPNGVTSHFWFSDPGIAVAFKFKLLELIQDHKNKSLNR
jgi:hypothetical protein